MLGRSKPKKLKKDDSLLSIDIGTELVKVALFEIENGEVVIYGYVRKRQKDTAMKNAVIVDLGEVIDTVDMAVGEVISMANRMFGKVFFPGKAIIGIAGELVRGVSIEVEVDREDPDERITQKEIETILANVEEYTFSNTINEISDEIGIPKEDIKEIDMQINSIYVNGNKSPSPIGLTGKHIVYKVFSTFAPKTHFNSIADITRKLNLDLEKVVVEPYAIATSIEGMSKQGVSGIFIDIGGGTTDIAIVDNGDVVGTKMFSIGGRAFTRKIQETFSLEYLKAEEKKIDYSLNKLSPTDTKQIRDIIKSEVDIWLEGVEITLSEFDNINEFPPRIYICGGGSLLGDIRTGIIEYPWTQMLNFKTFPRLELLLPNKVTNVTDLTKLALEPIDVTPLALARTALS